MYGHYKITSSGKAPKTTKKKSKKNTARVAAAGQIKQKLDY